MTESDMKRVQAYLRKLFGNEQIELIPPARPKASVEIAVRGETIGTLHKDEDEGEISFSAHLTILEEDLPAVAKAAPATARR
jgi:hypothetical protein